MAFKEFFRGHGILFNYYSAKGVPMANFSPLRKWASDYRLDFKDLNRDGANYNPATGDFTSIGSLSSKGALFMDDMYRIDAQILLNPVSLKDLGGY